MPPCSGGTVLCVDFHEFGGQLVVGEPGVHCLSSTGVGGVLQWSQLSLYSLVSGCQVLLGKESLALSCWRSGLADWMIA